MTIPRWGFHQGIKFSPRRSILKVCPICDEFFLKNTRGRREYCDDLCSVRARKLKMREVNKRIIQNRDKFEHADYMRGLYSVGSLSKRVFYVGTDDVPKVELNDDGDVDWDAYHQLLQDKLYRLGLV